MSSKRTRPAKTRLPKRLRRANSFLGIHFDFHAGDDCTRIGKRVTRPMVKRIIEQVRPDYIQCDCKGHRGLSSYKTNVGHRAPGFVRDPLRIWRDVTAKHGVALYMHYSGVADDEAVRRHPAWARIDQHGKRDPRNTSVFGPYVDKLLIPQLKELCDDYDVDGVWVDGECWSTCQDYRRKVTDAFRRQTGITNVPRSPDDPHFFEFTEFCREGFRKYLRHYVDALHEHDPAFQIASNWAFSSFMPEPVTADVDYLSGDYSLQDSVRVARLEARCLMGQGKPWDLMAWSFCSKFREGGASTKSVAQLQQEAAVVIALGGGFQAYFKQKRDASIEDWTMKLMAPVAKFCRARQKICHRAEPVPQIALVYCSAAFYRLSKRVFSPWEDELVPLRGTLDALLDAQQSIEILCEHHLHGRMQEYPLIVFPEWTCVAEEFREALVRYVRGGGNLLITGPRAAALFEKELGVRLEGAVELKPRWLSHDGWLCGLKTAGQAARPRRGVQTFGKLFAENDTVGRSIPAATVRRLGRGRIAGLYTDFGERYHNARTALARDFLAALVSRLMPKPIVQVKGSHCVDVSVMRQDDALAVNLVNTSGPHADPHVYTFDQIPPVGPLDVAIRTAKRPKRVRLAPGHRKVTWRYSKGQVRLRLSQLAIHDVVMVE